MSEVKLKDTHYYYNQLVLKLQQGGMSPKSANEIAEKLDEPLCSGLLRAIGELCFQKVESLSTNHSK